MKALNTQTLENWAGHSRPTLVLLFTDIVDSTAIGKKLRDDSWIEYLALHFQKGRELAEYHDGYVVKVIGDAFMIAFRNATDAVKFAIDFTLDTGVEFIAIRIGIHSGQVRIVDNDIYGLNVNEASRVQTSITREGIRLSDSVKRDFDRVVGFDSDTKLMSAKKDLKSFGITLLWDINSRAIRTAQRSAIEAREKITGRQTPKKVERASTPTITSGSGIFPRMPPLLGQSGSAVPKTLAELLGKSGRTNK